MRILILILTLMLSSALSAMNGGKRTTLRQSTGRGTLREMVRRTSVRRLTGLVGKKSTDESVAIDSNSTESDSSDEGKEKKWKFFSGGTFKTLRKKNRQNSRRPDEKLDISLNVSSQSEEEQRSSDGEKSDESRFESEVSEEVVRGSIRGLRKEEPLERRASVQSEDGLSLLTYGRIEEPEASTMSERYNDFRSRSLDKLGDCSTFKADVFDAFVTQDVSFIDRIVKDDPYGGKAAEICFLTTQLKIQYKEFLYQWTKSLSQKSKAKESKSSLSECELSPSERFMAFRAECLGRSLIQADVFDAFALQDISVIDRILADNSGSKLIWFKNGTQELVEGYYCFLKKWENRLRKNVTQETLNTAQQVEVALAVQKYLKEKESSS